MSPASLGASTKRRGRKGCCRTNYLPSSSLSPSPDCSLRVVGLSCHPAEEIPPRKPRALIAARGDATGLPMDRTKSRALCNPPRHPSPPLRSPLTYTPGRHARSFQFARVVHSTGDRKILGGRKFLLFYLTFLPPPLSLLSYLFFLRPPSKAHRCAGSLTLRGLSTHVPS